MQGVMEKMMLRQALLFHPCIPGCLLHPAGPCRHLAPRYGAALSPAHSPFPRTPPEQGSSARLLQAHAWRERIGWTLSSRSG